MEEFLGMLVLVVSIVMIVTFFNMSSKLTIIRDGIVSLANSPTRPEVTPGYWLAQYRKARMLGNTDEMAKAMQMYVYYKVRSEPVNNRKSEHGELSEKHQVTFTELGVPFPTWDVKVFQ